MRWQEVFEQQSSYGRRPWTLGLAAACLLVLTAFAFAGRHSARLPPEAIAEHESALSPRRDALLGSGDTVTLGTETMGVQRLAADELHGRTAWTGGLIQLDGKNLTEAVAEFNRYNRKKLTIADPTIADLQVSGTFRAGEPERFVATLARSAGVRTLAPGSRNLDSQDIRLVGANTQR
ncbi:MAG: transcriptional regulator [Gammaproteobacteria bacterium]|nr:transcriptional regulator [Gammaproteobacteria bacterium]